MIKYVVVKVKFDVHDNGILCLFDNIKQLRSRELSVSREIAMFKGCDKKGINPYLTVEMSPVKAKEGKKLLLHSYFTNFFWDNPLVFDYRENQEKTSVKDWYTSTFPEDELGAELADNVTFEQLFEAMDAYINPYKLLKIADSIIRERIFTRLAQIMHVDYNYIYDQWMKCRR